MKIVLFFIIFNLILGSLKSNVFAQNTGQQSNRDAAEIVELTQRFLSEVQSTANINDLCLGSIENASHQADQINLNSVLKESLIKESESIAALLWQIRLSLHSKLDSANDTCALQIRNIFRKFRFIEDYLSEISVGVTSINPKDIDYKKDLIFTPILTDVTDYLLQTRRYTFALQPGDLLVTRGVSFLSAMIARLGEVDSQFSHIAMVVENPKTHQLETIESYVGVGVTIYDLHTALKNENSRILVLRPKNEPQGKMVASQLRSQIAQCTDKTKIHYDYALDFTNNETMSCAEVSQYAFKTYGDMNIPERPSSLTRGLNLLEHLGIKPGLSYVPGDMEMDSRFNLVAEWRDLSLTRDSRQKDAIMTLIFKWMDEDQYRLRDSLLSKAAHGPIWTIRHTRLWPIFRKITGLSDFSDEVPRDMTGTVQLINQLAGGLQKKLSKMDSDFELKHGIPMTYSNLYDALETIRASDRKNFDSWSPFKKSIIYKYLRPDPAVTQAQ